ncbi:uncharacterized protein LOC122668609 [Telopea speciosissima]|uniref:uncharacterized protein LOC122668609 n=1 Tax=Telopea speciosissima TaxID=54955 RepID=UPI001CC5CF37|nr:uncharacterized protein LOC122668609 [Telopea speciosissima]
MNEMKEDNEGAYDWLMKTPVPMWARHAFDHRAKSDHITNNCTESFNHWVGPLRSKPILTLVDDLRVKMMKRLHKRYESGLTSFTRLTPTICEKLEAVWKGMRHCVPISAGREMFEIQDGSGLRYVVNMTESTCECGVWVATGLSCKHVGVCIPNYRGTLEDYCDPAYTTERYLMAYQEIIYPLSDLSTLQETDLLPPILKRGIGRPRMSRRREPDEATPCNSRKKRRSIKCQLCGGIDHNRRTCKYKDKRPSTSRSAPKRKRNNRDDDATST